MNIIAYGSLMNQQSLEQTLERSAQLTKITVPNMKRIFNAPFDQYAYLNLVPANNGIIEAAFFTLQEAEISKFAKREEGSVLTEVLPGYFVFLWPETKCQELPVLQSYINVCTAGSNALNLNFWQGTKIPKNIIDDTSKPLYH